MWSKNNRIDSLDNNLAEMNVSRYISWAHSGRIQQSVLLCFKMIEFTIKEAALKSAAYLTAFSLVLISTSQSYALSCTSAGFDLEESFQFNKKSGKNVVYVLGSFSGKQTPQRQTNNSAIEGTNGTLLVVQNPKDTVSNLSFSGKVMTKSGVKPFKQKVKVTASCAASWCGSIPKSGQKTIAALTKTKSGYSMTAGPCSPNTFSQNLDTDWKKLKRLVR